MNNFHNHEAEITLIGTILRREDVIAEAGAILKPDDFSINANGVIFSEMLEMYQKKIKIDILTVASHMSPETLKAIGGIQYISKASETPASLLTYREHISEIKRKSKNRKMAAALNEGMAMINETDADEVIELLQNKIVEAQAEGNAGLTQAPDIALDIVYGKPEPRIETGYRVMDKVMKGLRRGRVLTIAGRPGTGKTAFCVRILDQISETDRAIYFSLEMGAREIMERIMASQTQIKLDKIVDKTFDEKEQARLIDSKAMQNYNIVIDDSPGLTMQRIAAKARIEKIRNGLSVIFIDHIGLVNPSAKNMKAYERMTEISKGMKELAKELDITVIALSQLNRSPDARTGGEPLLSDLRDSGSIEQDSDQVILLYNPDYQDKTKENAAKKEECETLMAKIAKNRIGGVGTIQFDYYKATQVIEETRR